MTYIVYLTINLINFKKYIGVHKTENPDVFDGYLGCGININIPSTYKYSKNQFQYDVNKYGTDKFRRITLLVFDTEDDANDLLSKLTTKQWLKRSDTYNVDCIEDRSHKIYLYSINGEFEMEFDTALDAAKFCGDKTTSVLYKSMRLGRIYKNRFQVSDRFLPEMKNLNIPKMEKKPVDQYDLNGNFIKSWNSTTEAIKQYGTGVKKVLTGQQSHCHNYIFKYKTS